MMEHNELEDFLFVCVHNKMTAGAVQVAKQTAEEAGDRATRIYVSIAKSLRDQYRQEGRAVPTWHQLLAQLEQPYKITPIPNSIINKGMYLGNNYSRR